MRVDGAELRCRSRRPRAATSASPRTGGSSTRSRGGLHQHRRDRQQRGRRHLRPRGEHQDPARRRGARRRARRRRPQRAARSDDRRGRGARAARQLPPEPRARQRPRRRRRRWKTCTRGSCARSSSSGTSTATVERLPDRRDSSPTGATPGSASPCPSSRCCSRTPRSRSKRSCSRRPLPDDPDFVAELVRYFPTAVRERFLDRIRAHPLRREIIATALVNGMVNRAGTTFAFRLGEETGAPGPDIVRAHEAARAIFDQDALWRDIEALDAHARRRRADRHVPRSRRLVERGARWLLRNRAAAAARRDDRRVLRGPGRAPRPRWRPLSPRIEAATAALRRRRAFRDELAQRIAALDHLPRALDIAELADAHQRRGRRGRRRLRRGRRPSSASTGSATASSSCRAPTAGTALARNALREDAAAQYRRVVDAVLTAGSYDAWAEPRATVDRPRARAARRDPRPRASTTSRRFRSRCASSAVSTNSRPDSGNGCRKLGRRPMESGFFTGTGPIECRWASSFRTQEVVDGRKAGVDRNDLGHHVREDRVPARGSRGHVDEQDPADPTGGTAGADVDRAAVTSGDPRTR